MREPTTAGMVLWASVGAVLLYGALSVGVASIVATPDPSVPGATGIAARLAPLYAALPGADLWPRWIDLRGRLGGQFPTALACLLGLGLVGLGAWARARSIYGQLRRDAATAHDEAIRLRERARQARSKERRR